MVLESQYSNQVQAMAGDVLSPAQVMNLAFTVSQGKVTLTWDPVTTNADGSAITDLAGYRIYRKENEADAFGTAIATVGSGVTTFDDTSATGLKDGATFFYAVAAFDDEETSNEGAKSSTVQVKTIPSVPQNLAATVSDHSITLNWDSVKNEADPKLNENLAGYNIYRSLVDGVYSDVPIGTVAPDVTTFEDTSVENNQTYFYVVTAFDNSL